MFELLQKMLGIQQKQIIVIIEGGITVVGEEVDGILSIPREDMQIMNSSVTGTSLVRFRRVPTVVFLNTGYSHEIFRVKKEDSK